jgi:hypothetical protein
MSKHPPINGMVGYTSQADVITRTFKAGGTISKGNVVVHDTGDANGYTVIASSASTVPVGVALEDATDGDTVEVQIGGLGQVALTTGGSAAAGALLVAGASGATAETTVATATATQAATVLGLALAADSSTTLAAENYVLFPRGIW